MIRQPGDDMDVFEEEGNDNEDQVMENQDLEHLEQQEQQEQQEQEQNSNSDH
jgi:hypothetical protein